MRALWKKLAVGALAITLSGGIAIAQDQHEDQQHHDQDHRDKYVHHDEWKKGAHISHDDWNRGAVVSDWQTRHLRRPPRGYEWRDIDGQYVLANPDGVIFQVVIPH